MTTTNFTIRSEKTSRKARLAALFTTPQWGKNARLALAASIAMAGTLLLTPSQSRAAIIDDTFTLGADGLWNVGANWNNGVPNNGGGNTYNVFIDSNPGTNVTVTLNIIAAIDNLTIGLGDALAFNNAQSLTIASGGGVTNNGVISLNSTGSITDFILGGNLTLNGSGSLQLGAVAANRIQGTGTLTNSATHTISGGGSIGINALGINNAGTIDANLNGVVMTVDPSGAGGLTNTGTMRASNGGILLLNGFGGGGFNNTGGIISASTASEVQLNNSAGVTGGTLSTTGTGVIRTATGQTASLTDVTNTGTFIGSNNSTTNIAGTITNTGTILLGSTGNVADLVLNGAVTLTGSGTTTLQSAASIRGNGVLTNASTIQGSSSNNFGIGANAIGIINQSGALIDANAAGLALYVDPNNAVGLTNLGTMRASNGGILILNGFGTGTFNNAGGLITALNGSEVQLFQGAVVAGGTLGTTGTGVIRNLSGQTASLTDVTNTGTFIGTNNSTTNIAGTITNTGTILLGSTGNAADLVLNGAVTLTGVGTTTLQNAASIRGNGVLTNASTIQGSSSNNNGIGANAIGIINQSGALIDANAPGLALYVDPNSAVGLTNLGTMRASNGGILILNGFGSGAFNNAGGLITASNGSTVQLFQAAVVAGGTLGTTGTGVISIPVNQTGTLTDVTNTGTIIGDANSVTNISGTINNSGAITINAGSAVTDFRLTTNTSLTGGGAVFLASSGAGSNASVNGAFRLTNVNNAIQGEGNLGANQTAFTNQGAVDANITGRTLTVDPGNVVDAFINNGTLRASNGGFLLLSGSGGGGFSSTNGSAISAVGTGSEVRLTGGVALTNMGMSTGSGGVIRNLNSQTATLTDVTNTGTFIGNPDSVTNISGTINNSGSITISAGSAVTDFRLTTDASLTGGGAVFLASTGASSLAYIDGAFRLTNVNNTIQGEGNLGANQTAFTNQGAVDANITGRTLTVDPGNVVDAFINNGTLRASNGGFLLLSGSGGGGFSSTNGSAISAVGTGSEVRLTGGVALTNMGMSTGSGGVIRNLNSQTATLTDVTNTGTFIGNPDSVTNISGTINNSGSITISAGSAVTDFRLTTDASLTGGGAVFLASTGASSLAYIDGAFRLTNVNNTIQGEGNLGANQTAFTNQGAVDANITGRTLTVNPGNVVDAFVNDTTGILRASNGGTASLTGSGGGSFTNNGTFEVLDSSALTMDASAVLTNNVAGVLTGGTYRAVATGSSATMTVRGNAITQIAPNTTIELNGAGSVFQVAATPIESSLITNNGTLKVLGNRNYTTANAFANGATAGDAAVLQLGGGTFNALSLTNQSGSSIFGFGTITPRPTNHGLIRSNGGTLAFGSGIQGGSGTVQIDAGSTLDLSGGVLASSADNLFHNGTTPGSLNLGANNFNVGVDYNNASFGVGNSFDKRANVTGTGQILATAPFTISTSGTVAFGNVHVGDTANLSYTVNHDGSAGASPQVRTAIQTSVNGGNITDARLTGAGVTASNLAPIVSGAISASLGVTFTASAAGALTGQQVNIQSNFDNVAATALSITGAAYRYANPTAHTPEPVNFGNFHVGDTAPSQLLSIQNNVPADGFSEKLNASIGSPTGGVTTNGGTFNLLAPGATSSTDLSVGISTATAGSKNGTATIALTSDGTGTSGLGTTALTSQTVNVTGAVYRFASASAYSPQPINFGSFHVGDTAPSQAISVTNNAIADGFSESLNAAFGAPTGGVTATGSAGLIAPGAANPASSLTVGISTAAAGNQSGSVSLLLTSDGTGTSGLGTTPLTSQTVNVTGSVYRLASASAHTPEPANFGVVHVGDLVSQTITLQNTATNDGFSERLNASFSATTGDATAAGSFSQLNPQDTNNSSLTVGINTATVGNKTGTATIALVSDGTGTSGLGLTNLSSQTVNVQGQVNYFAEAKFTLTLGLGTLTQDNPTTFTLDYGTVAQNTGLLSSTLGVLNILQDPVFQDKLGGTFDTAAVTDFSLSGFNAFTNVAPGDSIATGVSFNTAMALGLYQQGLDLYSSSINASGTTGQAPIRLNLRGEIVPEPGSFLLLTLGGGLLLGRRRRKATV